MPTASSDLLAASTSACSSAISLYGEHWRRTYSDELSTASPRAVFNAQVARQIGSEWTTALGERVTLRAILYMSAAREHLQGLRALLHTHPFGLTVAPAARSVLEATGRGMWLISHQLNLDTQTRKRVARLCIDEEDDARANLQLLKKTDRQNDIADAVKVHATARSHLREPGLFISTEIQVEPDGSRRFISLCGEVPPSLNGLALLALSPHGSPDRNASFMYSVLSNMTHSKFSALIEAVSAPSDESPWLWPLQEDAVFCAKLASVTLAAFINGWTTLARWLERDTPELEILEALHADLNSQIGGYE